MLICLRSCTLFCPKCLRCSANYCFVIWTCRKGMKIYQFWGKGQLKNESIGAQTTQDVAFHEIRFHLSNGLSVLFDIITTNVKSKLFPGVATRSITQQAVGVSWCMVRTCYLARDRHVWSKTWNAMNEKCFVGNCDLEVLTLCSYLWWRERVDEFLHFVLGDASSDFGPSVDLRRPRVALPSQQQTACEARK